MWHFLFLEKATDHACNDLILIDLASGLGRVLITSFIPVVLVFLGFRRRNSIGGDFFIWELKTLHEIHHNLLSFLLLLLRQSIHRDVVIRRFRCGIHAHLFDNQLV
jgi:hypothetical protein